MMIDVVFPQGNEQKFIEMAEMLGYSSICFVYERDKDISALQSATKLRLFKAFTYGKNKKGFLVASSSAQDRYLVESRSVGMIYDFELAQKSQLNHILAALCAQRGILVGFSFTTVLNSANRAKILGRISKHIRLCRKYKVRMVLGSFAADPYEMRNPHDLMAFGKAVGMTPLEAKQSLLNLKERLEKT